MTTSAHQHGQYDDIGLNLGRLQNVSSHTSLLGGTRITSRYEHGTITMDEAAAILYQRELLAALQTHGWRADISGSRANLGGEDT